MQVVQDPNLQRTLNLMNQTVHALNVLQLFISIFVGYCALFSIMLCIYVFKSMPDPSAITPLTGALNSIFYSVVFFSFYPILYAQQRAEIEYLVGTGYTILPHVFSAIFVVCLLLALLSLDPIKKNVSNFIISRIIPVFILASGFGSQYIQSQPLRQLVGVLTNAGIQIMISIFFIIASVLVSLHIWPRSK